MGRQDADDGDARAGQLAARDAELEREGAGAADDRVAVERGMDPVDREQLTEPLEVLARPRAAEVVADRADRRLRTRQRPCRCESGAPSVDLLERSVLEHQLPLARVSGEADRDEPARLDPGHDALAERPVPDGVTRLQRGDRGRVAHAGGAGVCRSEP